MVTGESLCKDDDGRIRQHHGLELKERVLSTCLNSTQILASLFDVDGFVGECKRVQIDIL